MRSLPVLVAVRHVSAVHRARSESETRSRVLEVVLQPDKPTTQLEGRKMPNHPAVG